LPSLPSFSIPEIKLPAFPTIALGLPLPRVSIPRIDLLFPPLPEITVILPEITVKTRVE
jgi:hypothetical protein